MGAADPPFVVLLGRDYAGKSSAMTRLASNPSPWTLISVDNDFLPARHALLGRLRREISTDVARNRDYSPEFLATMLQTAVVYLRDRILACLRNRSPAPILVDSYYYKIAAKCRLAGAQRSLPLFAWWRSFPQPRRVVYLEVSAASAWQRSREGAALGPLEYYGDDPTPAAFERYQTDLDAAMREEIIGLPLTVVRETTPERTVDAIREVLQHEHS